MSAAGAPHPNLKLVGFSDAQSRQDWAQLQQARLAVIKENRIAAHGASAGIVAHDPRWRLAMQTQAQLQGAILAPERRERLMRSARQLGLRPFEANLIMAMVQDSARNQQSPAEVLREATMERGRRQPEHLAENTNRAACEIVTVRPATGQPAAMKAPARSPYADWLRLMAALIASATIAVALARWITSQ